MEPSKKLQCSDYQVAWISPLADYELQPARLMLDEEHSSPDYDDDNVYTFGTMSGHNVVLASLPKGYADNVNAALLTASVQKTFHNIKTVLLVGIGGGVPHPIPCDDPLQDIHLGDVVVGWPGDGRPAVVASDRGRMRPEGFQLLGTTDSPSRKLLSALSKLISDHENEKTKFQEHLSRLKQKKYSHPGLEYDRLFQSHCPHLGGYWSECADCDASRLVQRPQRKDTSLVFHQGRIATGNAVVQSGQDRDRISEDCGGVRCIEMEAAGVDACAKSLVIRGISDYCDDHKNDLWKDHAAGNAAAFGRELLCKLPPGLREKTTIAEPSFEAKHWVSQQDLRSWERSSMQQLDSSTLNDMSTTEPTPWLVPFARNGNFVCRSELLTKLDKMLSSTKTCQRAAIWGIGGCGKTAIALEYAYRTRELHPQRAIFWIPAITRLGFEEEYQKIAKALNITGIDNANADIKQLIKMKLSNEDFGEWLMIIDNADDLDVLYNKPKDDKNKSCLIDYLPDSRRGSILFTTRTRHTAVDQVQGGSNTMELSAMEESQASEMLQKRLRDQEQLRDDKIVKELLDALAFLPLAIAQAVAYINKAGIPISKYLSRLKSKEDQSHGVLTHHFEAHGRYREMQNAVEATWYISFNHIKQKHLLAAKYLSLMACVARESIPRSLLPQDSSPMERAEAIDILTAYQFITERTPEAEAGEGEKREEEEVDKKEEGEREAFFDVHQLVHSATRNWLKLNDEWHGQIRETAARLQEVLKCIDIPRSIGTRAAYIHHAFEILPEMSESAAQISLTRQMVSYWDFHERHEKVVWVIQGVSRFFLGKAVMGKKDLSLLSNAYYRGSAERIQKGKDMMRQISGRRHSVKAKKINTTALGLLRNISG